MHRHALELVIRGRDDVLDYLTSLFDKPAWMRDAACREHPTNLFFPRRGGATLNAARKVCASCLVVDECRAYADGFVEVKGVWAGTSERERARRTRTTAA